MKERMVESVLKLINNSKFIKEIKFIDGYEKFLKSSYYDNSLSAVLNQLVYAIDFRNQSFIHLSKNVNEVFGLSYDEMIANGPMDLYKYILPEDNELLDKKILKCITEVALKEKDFEPENLRFAYNFRLKDSNGHQRCILNRFSVIIFGEYGLPLVFVGTMTDVTHLYDKRELFCEGTRVHKDGSTTEILYKVFPSLPKKNDFSLSKKEFEVLALVVKGYISKEIADKTNRSIETIHSHRKNIIKKMNCNNITDAVLIAKDLNWF